MKTSGRRSGAIVGCSVAGLVLAASSPFLHAADDAAFDGSVDTLRQRIEEQSRQIESLKQDLSRQQAVLHDMRRALDISGISGRGPAPAVPATVAAPPPPAVSPPAQQVAQAPVQRPVGEAPTRTDNRPPPVAPIFEQPGVLTPRGTWILEPSLQYAYSSSNRIALIGYTIIPALLIGLIDVREVKSNSLTAALTVRRGITNRFELEAKIPYVYRWDSSVSREVAAGSANPEVFDTDGNDIGDIELTGRYQLNDGGADQPYYIASLRFKSRTGTDPFEVEIDRTIRSTTGGVGLQTEIPTGSGFYSLQPGLTVLIPSDPVVFFGGVSYQYSFKRDNVKQKTNEGDIELGEVQPGGAFGFNFGMGLALNERSSFSIGYDHLSVGKVKQNGQTAATSVRVQLGTLLLGYSYRMAPNRTLNLSVGAGLTEDTPDLQLTLRMPITL